VLEGLIKSTSAGDTEQSCVTTVTVGNHVAAFFVLSDSDKGYALFMYLFVNKRL